MNLLAFYWRNLSRRKEWNAYMTEKQQKQPSSEEEKQADEASRVILTSDVSQEDSPYEHPDLLYGK